MKEFFIFSSLLALSIAGIAQAPSKMPLDHAVYDGWQVVSSASVSNDGKWVLYCLMPQEGDAELTILNLNTSALSRYSRVTAADFTADSRFAAFMIKPFFKDTQDAKIKKKAPADMPQDTLGIATLGGGLKKIPRVKSYKLPEEGGGVIAYLVNTPADSAAGSGATGAAAGGGELWVVNLNTNAENAFKYVTDYFFSKDGTTLIYACEGLKTDTITEPGLFIYNTVTGISKKISTGKAAYRNLVFDKTVPQIAITTGKGTAEAPVKVNRHLMPGGDGNLDLLTPFRFRHVIEL